MLSSSVFMPISELSELIRTKQISSVELTEIFLSRMERIGPRLNAVVTVTREHALKQARQADRELASGRHRSLLHGIPYGAKDLLATCRGIPTTWGAAPFRNQVLSYDATVIKKLKKAGAVLIAKLAMIELAGGMGYRQPNASFTGPPHNPWNTGMWAGGSSSGSGIAVSAGLVPFSIGSETWGSILRPANNCGVTGLRPTYGRVSRYGAMALSWSLDKLGPLALNAEDCGLILEAIAGPDPKDPTTIPRAFKYSRNKEMPFKLGIPQGAIEDLDKEVDENFRRSLTAIEKMALLEEFEFPSFPYEAMTRTILNAESASAFDMMVEDGKVLGLTAPEDRVGAYHRTAVLAKDYLKALRLREVVSKAVDQTISSFDAVIAPTSRTAATPIDQPFRHPTLRTGDLIGALGNCVGLPSISVPNGFTEKGLPTGLQFMGRAFDENSILSVAQEYQAATNWHKRHPSLDKD